MSTTTPEYANEGCVGPASETAGKASACAGCPNQSACSSGKFNSPEAIAAAETEAESLRSSLSNISHILLVLSGKGGVGKSTVACQVAHTLASRGYHVGVLDVDICGPSVPRMLGVSGREVHKSGSGWSPVYANPNLAVMSISFLLPDADAAVVWRGPRKNGMIKQFLTETDWEGTDGLDYLIVDTPPGTSDEHISTVQFLNNLEGGVSGAVVVTTPEEVSMADVRKELNFCKKTNVRVVGIVENMSGLQVKVDNLKFSRLPPKEAKMETDDNDAMDQDETNINGIGTNVDCTKEVLDILRAKCPEVLDMVASADVFPPTGGGPREMAKRFEVPYLGSLPLDPNLLKSCEEGTCFVDSYKDSPAITSLNDVVDRIVEELPADVEWED
uniref:Cytosolic Fe-S cluster assembly factor NUBP1 homolog n=1 Tax=Helicotheca tamesis TaxID=374047 RepID=A0A7S2MGE3_9STRA